MADVKIIDIDSEQWNMKDQNARDRIYTIEQLITQKNTIRRDIAAAPTTQKNCLWAYYMQQVAGTDWSFLNVGQCAYGKFEIVGVCWGTYQAQKFSDNSIVVKGSLLYSAEPHTFEAFFDAPNNYWYFSLDDEGLRYLENNILVTYRMSRVNNNYTSPSEVIVRNVAETTIGNLYSALETCGLLNRPAIGAMLWVLQHQHDGTDLPKGRVGYPAYASSGEYSFSGNLYLQNPRISTVDNQNNSWIFNWSDGNAYLDANMWGEPFQGILKTVSLLFVI